MAAHLDRLTADKVIAMKAGEKDRLTVIRMLIAGIQEAQHKAGEDALGEAEEMQVLMRAVKTRRDSVQQAMDANRPEIAAAETAEIKIVEAYLPQQMSADEVLTEARKLAQEIEYQGPKDTGKFMKEWMSRFKGQADGRDVQAALKNLQP